VKVEAGALRGRMGRRQEHLLACSLWMVMVVYCRFLLDCSAPVLEQSVGRAHFCCFYNNRIIEHLKLEGTIRMIESNSGVEVPGRST